MNKKIIILAVLVILAIAYVVMKKDATESEMTPVATVAVEEVIANEEAGSAVPTPDAVIEEEGVVVEEVMPTADEVAPVAEEVAPEAPVAAETNPTAGN